MIADRQIDRIELADFKNQWGSSLFFSKSDFDAYSQATAESPNNPSDIMSYASQQLDLNPCLKENVRRSRAHT